MRFHFISFRFSWITSIPFDEIFQEIFPSGLFFIARGLTLQPKSNRTIFQWRPTTCLTIIDWEDRKVWKWFNHQYRDHWDSPFLVELVRKDSIEIEKYRGVFEAAIMTTSIRSKLEEGNEGNLNKLLKALDMLSVLEKRHQDLLKEYEALTEKYLYTKKCSIDAVWRYIPMKSR